MKTNNKKRISLLLVLSMMIVYLIPFNIIGVSAADDIVWLFDESAPAGVSLTNASGKDKEWYTTNTDLGNGLMAYVLDSIDETKQEYNRAFEIDRKSVTDFTVNGETEQTTGVLKFGGKSGSDYRYLTYTPSENGTLTAYVKHGSANKPNTDIRSLIMTQGGESVTVATIGTDAPNLVGSLSVVADTEIKITCDNNVGITKLVFTPGEGGEVPAVTDAPTEVPVVTDAPTTEAPTEAPVVTDTPTTETPTQAPTEAPTTPPTTDTPVITQAPTATPVTDGPTAAPTAEPTAAPTLKPTPAPGEELSPDEQAVRKDAAALTLKAVSQTAIYFDIDLDKKGSNGSTITWESSNPEYIDIQMISHINRNYTGVVTRPTSDECDENGGVPVTLTATLKKGDAEYQKTFDVSVREWNPLYYNDFEADVDKTAEGEYLEIADNVESVTGESFRGIRIDTLRESRCFEAFGHNDVDMPMYFDKRIMSTDEKYGKPQGSDDGENFAFYYNEYKAYGGSSTIPMWIKLTDPETGLAPAGMVMMSMDIYTIRGKNKFQLGFGTAKPSQMCRFMLGSGDADDLGYDGGGYLRMFSNTSSIDFMGGDDGYRHPVGDWVTAVIVANADTAKWDFYFDGMQVASGLDFRNAQDVVSTIEFTLDRNTTGGIYLLDNIYVENLTDDYRQTYWESYVPDTLVYDEEAQAYVVDSDFLLQYQGTDGLAGNYFTWSSSNPSVLSVATKRIPTDDLASYGYSESEIKALKEKGVEDVSVNLATPAQLTEDTYVTLTAKIEIGETINRKDFKVLVKAAGAETETGDSAKAKEDAAAISSVKDGQKVTGNLSLETKGPKNGSTITWKSSNEKVISTTGKVTRQSSAVDVTLTATVKYGDAVEYKTFTVEVAAKASSGGGGGGGGGGSSSGSGGGSISTPSTSTTVPQSTQKPSTNVVTPTVGVNSFEDLYKAEWAREAVEYLFSKDIVNGYGNGLYGVNDDVTREQFVRMLLTALNIKLPETENNIFADVEDNTWYVNYVNAAYVMGIVSGVSETEFGVGMPISRQDMAVMCIRALDYVNKNPEAVIEDVEEEAVEATTEPVEAEEVTEEAVEVTTEPAEAEEAAEDTVETTEAPEETEAPAEEVSEEAPAETEAPVEEESDADVSDIPFADKGEIADYALSAVARMAADGYLSGDENGNFAPTKTSTRAETAVVLYRILIQEDL